MFFLLIIEINVALGMGSARFSSFAAFGRMLAVGSSWPNQENECFVQLTTMQPKGPRDTIYKDIHYSKRILSFMWHEAWALLVIAVATGECAASGDASIALEQLCAVVNL